MIRFASWGRPRPLPIGLHVDGDTVTAAQLVVQGGRASVHAVAAGDWPAEPDRAATALRRLLADHHFSGRAVVSVLPTQDICVQNVRLPDVPEAELPELLRWEARERLPFPADDAEVRHLVGGVVRQDGTARQEVILLAAKGEAVRRHVALLEAAGLTPHAIDLDGCALLRSLPARAASPTGEDGSSRRAVLHLGASAVTVLVAGGGRVMFLKHLPTGGKSLDRTLARAVGLPEPEAAAMRRSVVRAAALDPADDLHRTVIDALRQPLEALASEIELCLRHVKVTFRGAPPESLSVTGPDASAWLAEFLADRLRVPAAAEHPFDRFPRPGGPPDEPCRFAVAAGLSLFGEAASVVTPAA